MRDVAGLNFHRQGGVATVTLNRPERLNAITWKLEDGRRSHRFHRRMQP